MERASFGRLPVVHQVAASDTALLGPGSDLQDETFVVRLRVCICARCEAVQQSFDASRATQVNETKRGDRRSSGAGGVGIYARMLRDVKEYRAAGRNGSKVISENKP
jgi:hypothetical protein